jgi:hypothetical protein
MKMLVRAALALLALSNCALMTPALAVPIIATVPIPQCMNAGGSNFPCSGAVLIDPATGNPYSSSNPLPVSGGGGGGGGGGAITASDGAIVGIGTLSSPAVGSTNYRLGQLLTALGTPYQAGGALPLPPGAATDVVAKAAAASFTFAPPSGAAESSTAASYSFSSANVALARAWYSDCPTGTTVKVAMTDPNGGTAPVTLYDGHYGPVAERIASFAGNSGACTIGLEF